MKTLKRIGRFCGSICALVMTFVIAVGTMAVTNAMSPVAFKEKMITTADKIVDAATGQMVTSGVPQTFADMIRTNIGTDQFVAMLYMSAIGFLGAIFWLIAGSIWSHLFPGRGKPSLNAPDIAQGPAEAA